MAASTSGVLVDDDVVEVLKKAQLDAFVNKFIFNLHVRRFDHCLNIREKDMLDIGMQSHQIRNYREQVQKMHREMWNRSAAKQIYIQSDVSNQNFESALDDRTLIPSEQIKLYEKLGEGSFAVVKRGIWVQNDGRKIDVAIKILRDVSPMVLEDLRVEASHLLKLHHPSLIRLYGIVRQPAMMVFELCEGGSLLDRLRDDKKSIPLVTILLDYSVQIAKALQFLESKHCLHRDVAARNILLSLDEKTVKICDFGLMRDLKNNEQMYTMAPQKKVPFAWCAPESLSHRKFSHASDVWSYGVTIWEIFTYGEEPWAGCRAVDVLNNIKSGERLEKPKYCSQKIYQIMLNCWKNEPSERCKFGAIREDLKSATFLDAIVREPYKSIQPGCLQLNVSDEIIVIENGNNEWFGQNKKSRHFGTFPRSCIFVQSNHAANAVPTLTPQKLPSVSRVILPEHNMPKKVQERSNPQPISGSSRISMPVIGSFIHTGHGDPLGGQSWGSPSTIDDTYLKNPVKGVPMERTLRGAEIIKSKSELTNGGNHNEVSVSSQPATLSLQLTDLNNEFEVAFNDSFSPSAIEYPRSFGVHNTSNISNISVVNSNEIGTTLIQTNNPLSSFDIRGNQILQPTPVPAKPSLLESNTNGVNDNIIDLSKLAAQSSSIPPRTSFANSTQPRHVLSAGSRLNSLADSQQVPQKSFSNGNEPKERMDKQIIRPRPSSSIEVQAPVENSVFPLHHSSVRPISVANTPIILPSQSSLPCLIPTPAPSSRFENKLPTQPTPLQKALANELKGNIDRKNAEKSVPSASKDIPSSILPTPPSYSAGTTSSLQNSNKVSTTPPSNSQEHPRQSSTSHISSTSIGQPTEKGKGENIAKLPHPQSSSTAPKPINSRAHRLSDEERRSQIVAEINSLLPAPSSLLLGTNTANTNITSCPSTSSQSVEKVPVTSAPVKKVSEPVLSLSTVLQPTKLSTSVDVKSSSTSDLQKVATNSKQIGNSNAMNKKNDTIRAEPSQVPLFNITNSNSQITYPQINPYPTYGYGMNSGYGFYGGYNSYYNPYNQSQINYPPLPPSENRASPVITQPLNPSDIDEFLGTSSMPRAVEPTPSSDISMTNRMEVLYQEAHFTLKSNCDAMVSKCNGNFELALKKLKEQHLVELGLALNIENAERALKSQNYDLTAAANMLLG